MPDEDKTTNINQPLTGGTPLADQPDPTTASTISTTSLSSTPPDISDQAIDTPPPPPMEDGAVSPPPPIVEEKKPEETTTPTQETEKTESTQAIPDIPPVITTSGAGGKKPVGKKMIATILGVLVLVGGIGAGVILVQNQQDIREKAGTCTEGYIGTTGECRDGKMCRTYRFPNCDTEVRCDGPSCTDSSSRFVPTPEPVETPSTTTSSPSDYDKCIADGNTPTECAGIIDSATPSTRQCPSGTICRKQIDGCPSGYSEVGGACEIVDSICCGADEGGTACIIDGYCLEGTRDVCCSLKEYGDPTCTTPIKKRCGSGPATTAPTSKPTAKPTLPPGVTASCLNIRAFDSEWSSITNLSSLAAGDVVRFTVAGNASSGSFDKARFTINGTLRPEVSVKRPSTDEFYDEYTIPESVTTFTINAEIHHSSLGWF